MASNTNIQVASLDFSGIKQSFITYLQSQDTFKDYNFSGSAMSTLLDVLAYNTQYNAYYLNMVANEMFLDSALQRSSVVSHAKLMNYVPQSAVAPVAEVNVAFSGITTTTFSIPKYTNFISGVMPDGTHYPYVTTDMYTTNVVANTATFTAIQLKQGAAATYTYTVDSTSNPKYIFEIPDADIDTSTLVVRVQQSSTNTSYQIFNSTTDYLSLTPTSAVYFLQEAVNGNYQIYFGDGVLGQKLSDGNIIILNYISTKGTAGGLANSFQLMDNLGNPSQPTVTTYQAASMGRDKETIDSIKFQAPKAFASQGRAVSKNDYINIIQQNTLGIQFDAVSVWGGEENNPPVYGQVFIALKPTGAYDLTPTQKSMLLTEVIKPISVVTVEPTIVDPDYTYLQVAANVLYQPSMTTLTPSGLQTGVQNAIYNYSTTNLNTFNSTFSSYDLLSAINSYDRSIISSDYTINLQKKFYPTLKTPTTYNLYYNTPIKRGTFGSGITSYPGFQTVDPTNPANILNNVFFEEVPVFTSNVASISVLNTGFSYTATPTIVITGDGTGATAEATIVSGRLVSVTVTNSGVGYSGAIATVLPAVGDLSGQGAQLQVNLFNQYGTLKTFYNDVTKGQVTVNANAGTVDYVNGIITLNNFNPVDINNPLGQLTLSVQPTTNIIQSTYNRIITIDPYDSAAVSVAVNAKKS
jgi:hypothetical protein